MPINCQKAVPASRHWSKLSAQPQAGLSPGTGQGRGVFAQLPASLGIVRGTYRMPVRDNIVPLSDGAGEVVEGRRRRHACEGRGQGGRLLLPTLVWGKGGP